MHQEGALIAASRGRPEAFGPALDAVLTTLGYARDDGGELSLFTYSPARGGCLTATMPPSLARALARRLATQLAAPVSLLHGTAVFREDTKPACRFDAFEVVYEADGRQAVPRPPVVDELDFDDEALDTDKPWRLVEWALDAAMHAWAPGAGRSLGSTSYRAPPLTGVPKLDGLLTEVRLGAAAEIATVDGRAAVRVKTEDGSTITTFVTPEELARLRELAPMLRG
jgi:hypothetical protein